jgi:hypothetical protein
MHRTHSLPGGPRPNGWELVGAIAALLLVLAAAGPGQRSVDTFGSYTNLDLLFGDVANFASHIPAQRGKRVLRVLRIARAA